eukprot:1052602-Amorphochlora_amoeboformis.AAC.2
MKRAHPSNLNPQLASLATAEPIPVNHVPAFDDMKPDLNSSEEAVMGGDIAEIAVPGIVLEISGSPGTKLGAK